MKNHSSKLFELKFPEMLDVPIPCLLQENSEEELLDHKDENGWNFQHWAVITGNSSKIAEGLNLGIGFKSTLDAKQITKEAMEFAHPDTSFVIPPLSFSHGMSPLHMTIHALHGVFDKRANPNEASLD